MDLKRQRRRLSPWRPRAEEDLQPAGNPSPIAQVATLSRTRREHIGSDCRCDGKGRQGGVITVEECPGLRNELEWLKACIRSRYLSPYFINIIRVQEPELEKPLILLVDRRSPHPRLLPAARNHRRLPPVADRRRKTSRARRLHARRHTIRGIVKEVAAVKGAGLSVNRRQGHAAGQCGPYGRTVHFR